MENRAHALIVGLFVILMSAAGVLSLWWFSGSGQDYNYYELVSSRPVSGLNPQAAVRFRGVRVGRVLNIELDEAGSRNVIVTIRVSSEVKLTRGTRATLGTTGLTGLAFVQLDDDGHDPRPLDAQGQELAQIPLGQGLMDSATDAGRDMIGRLREATTRIERVLSDQNVERVDQVLRNLAASSAHLEKTLANSAELSADMRRFTSSQNAEQMSAAIRELSAAARQVQPVLADARRTLDRWDRLAADLNNAVAGETLPRVNQLASELQGTAAQLNRVLDELERSPNMLVFGREAPPPGPGEKTP